MPSFFNSLRCRLIFLIILALIPCFGLTLFGNLEQRRLALTRAHDSAFQSAKDFAEIMGFVIDESRQMLSSLALEPQIRQLQAGSCSYLFNPKFFKHAFPLYDNLGLINTEGKLVCSLFPIVSSEPIADQSYFKEAIRTREFAVGLVQNGSVHEKGTVNMGYPVLDGSGEIRGVIFVALDLSWFDHLASHAGLPGHATLTVIDGLGTVIARSSDPDKWVGRSAPDSEIIKKVLNDGEGLTEAVGLDGIRKIYGFKKPGEFSKGIYVYVGIPRDRVVAEANRLLLFDLIWLGIAAFIGVVAVLVLAYFFIVKQMGTLIRATAKIAGGDLSARANLDNNQGELSLLGNAFDTMAAALQQREEENRQSHKELEREKHFSDMVIDSLPGVFYLINTKGKILRWNTNAEVVTGYSGAEISSMRAIDFIVDADKNILTEEFSQISEKGEIGIEAHYRTKAGGAIPYYFTGRMVEIDQSKCVVGVGIDISDRLRAEKALEENERLLKTILAASPVGIHLADKRQIKWANDAWVQMFGFEQELEYVGQSARILYQSDDEFDRVGQVLYQDLEPGKITEIDAKLKRKDGSNFDGVIRITHLNPSEPENHTIVAVVTDISRRIRNEQALRESEERYRNLIDTMTEGLALIDENGIIEYVNKRSAEMLGYREDELIGHSVDEFLTKSSVKTVIEQRSLRKSVPTRSYELEWVRKDGKSIHTLVTSRSIWDADGALKGSLATATDITERKQYEKRLQDSEKKMRLLIEQAPIGVGIFQDGKYAYANPELVTVFNCQDADEIIGRPLPQFVAPGHQRLFVERCKRNLAGKPTRPSYQVEGVKKTGELFDMVLWPKKIDYEGSPAILAFVMDVTETKKLRAQLMQAQKMEAVGTLAGGIAHDFNNLLQVVIGYSEIMLLDKTLSDKLKQKVRSINKVASNGADLVRRLLTFSRKTETRPKPLDLNYEINQIQKLLDRTIPKMIEIEQNLSDNLNPINADASQMEQIIMNLAVNARDAMPDGGKLIIETDNVTLDATHCATHIEAKPGLYVLLTVSDTGHGINKKTLEHIFEPFFTTKGPGQGTGLGLAMVYGIVKQHGGYTTCYSEPGVGTTFKIYFPAMISQVISEKPEEIETPKGGTETILLVDDEETIRDVGRDLLESAGYQVITARTGQEALEIYRAKSDSISLVILDLIMPEMGGKECLEELLKIDPVVKTLICSGLSPNGAAKAALKTGAKGFIGKPYNSTEMLSGIRKILDR